MANYNFIGGDGKSYGPYTAEQMRQFMAENRLTPQSQVSADGGPWQPTGSFPELTGGAGAMPTAPQPMAGNPALLQSKVNGPAIFMMVLAIINLVFAPIGIILNIVQEPNPDLPEELRMLQGPIGIINNILWMITNAIILMGALKMKKFQSYGLAMTASILCILCDWSCCCLGIGAGIWSIVVLNNAQVKAAFR
jgi:hypothetical protein